MCKNKQIEQLIAFKIAQCWEYKTRLKICALVRAAII